ncbi:TPA: hypothetical protein RQJ47_002560 [Vibrio vulnificus]|nr:hypothetical protein [Vibrio vulnificus]HDY8209503.1 hypothetical protein [Vibrio vulnificus]
MTAQVSEVLIYNGEKVRLHSAPTIPEQHPHIQLDTKQPEFISTACWRGYVGTWEITNRKLYLTSVDGKYIVTAPVFADWYCGTLVIPESEPGEYFHGGWGHDYAKNKLITIVNGEVTNVQYQNKMAPGYIDNWAKQRLNQVVGVLAETADKLYLLPDNNDINRRLIAFTFEQKAIFESMAGKLFITLQACRQRWPISVTLAQPNKIGGNKFHNIAISIPTLLAVELEQLFSFNYHYNSDNTENIIDNIENVWLFSAIEKPKPEAQSTMKYDKPPLDFDDNDIPF